MGPDTLSNFIQWCTSNGICVDSRVILRCQPTGEVAVFTKDEWIPSGSTVANIPKSCVLSVKTCRLFDGMPTKYHGHEAVLALALAVYTEILLHTSSPFYPYLHSMPEAMVDIPMFWNLPASEQKACQRAPEHEQDGLEATAMLSGTEVEKRLRPHGLRLIDGIRQYYYEIARPRLSAYFDCLSTINPGLHISGFYYAYSLVSSRAFLVDQYHGLAMVPIADAFNHALDNHVHLESDFYVCGTCGSLQECTHDGVADGLNNNDSGTNPRKPISQLEHDNYYEMAANTVIPPHSEVSNTYGESLTNADLLARYGFVLDVNENDRIVFTHAEFPKRIQPWVGQITSFDLPASSGSELVQSPRQAHESPESGFNIDGDGNISHHLWAACVIGASGISSITENDRISEVNNAFRDLLTLEALQCGDEDVDANLLASESSFRRDCEGPEEAPVSHHTIEKAAYAIIEMCDSRLARSGKPGVEDFGLFLDELPPHMRRTRAITQVVLQEHSILNSCRSRWLEILGQFNSLAFQIQGEHTQGRYRQRANVTQEV